jgi:hypothetical protein
MKKWIFSMAFLSALAFAPLYSQNMVLDEEQIPPAKFFPGESGYVSPSSVPTGHLTVRPMQLKGFNFRAMYKVNEAFMLLERAINSEEFKERVLNFKNFDGERAFASNKGLSNEEIYEHLMEGRETLQPDTPGEINFYLKMYHNPFSKVIGYTTPSSNTINTNWKFFKDFRAHQVASNLAHEWVHKMGFGHESAKEHDSVPYAVGYIIGDIAKKMQKESRPH